jgi:hypothetical protein
VLGTCSATVLLAVLGSARAGAEAEFGDPGLGHEVAIFCFDRAAVFGDLLHDIFCGWGFCVRVFRKIVSGARSEICEAEEG